MIIGFEDPSLRLVILSILTLPEGAEILKVIDPFLDGREVEEEPVQPTVPGKNSWSEYDGNSLSLEQDAGMLMLN